jgi:hypothetical protein
MRPQSVDDIVDFSVARVLDLLDVPHTLAARWNANTPTTPGIKSNELTTTCAISSPNWNRAASCAA